MNADQSIAVTTAVNAVVDEVRQVASGLAAKYRKTVEDIANTAQAVALAFVDGQITAAQAEADVKKLTNATASQLLSAGYDSKAATIDFAGKALAVAFKLAAALLAA